MTWLISFDVFTGARRSSVKEKKPFTVRIPDHAIHADGMYVPSQGFWGTRAFLSGDQGNKGLKMWGTREQRQYWGKGNIGNQIFDFGEGEQSVLFLEEQGNNPLEEPHV